jgi:hypothetical protein
MLPSPGAPAMLLLLVLSLSPDGFDEDFSDSLSVAEVKVSEIARNVSRELASKDSKDTKQEKINARLEYANKTLAGKKVKWPVTVAKPVGPGDKSAVVVVRKWVRGSGGARITFDGNGAKDVYVLRVPFKGDWGKALKAGDTVVLEGVVTSVGLSSTTVLVALSEVTIKQRAGRPD